MGPADYRRFFGDDCEHRILSTDTRRMRLFYLIFLPSWVLLALSIYRGIRIQGSYIAYLVAAQRNDTDLIRASAEDERRC